MHYVSAITSGYSNREIAAHDMRKTSTYLGDKILCFINNCLVVKDDDQCLDGLVMNQNRTTKRTMTGNIRSQMTQDEDDIKFKMKVDDRKIQDKDTAWLTQ